METEDEEKEYLEEDVTKILLEHLKRLGIDLEMVELGKTVIEKPPYYSLYFSGTSRMVDSMGCMKVKGKNFDYIHVIGRG